MAEILRRFITALWETLTAMSPYLLFGFFVAAVVVGVLAERGWSRHAAGALAAALIGTVVIYLFGVAWLSTLIGAEKAVTAGMIPFLVGDGLKVALAAAVLPFAWSLVDRRGGS